MEKTSRTRARARMHATNQSSFLAIFNLRSLVIGHFSSLLLMPSHTMSSYMQSNGSSSAPFGGAISAKDAAEATSFAKSTANDLKENLMQGAYWRSDSLFSLLLAIRHISLLLAYNISPLILHVSFDPILYFSFDSSFLIRSHFTFLTLLYSLNPVQQSRQLESSYSRITWRFGDDCGVDPRFH